MPLSFATVDRGPVAFGFFHIESDMLLLERHFFFADAFCRAVAEVAYSDADAPFARTLAVHTIERQLDVGDLMGAIHGIRFTGFIGETYRRHPFPSAPEGFRQNPDGHETRAEFLEMLLPFAVEEELPFSGAPRPQEVRLGEHRFSREGFVALVRYVWRGGYPRWRDGVRPPYVAELAAALSRSGHWLVRDLDLRAR